MTCRNRVTRAGAVSGALSGFVCGIISWLAYAQVCHFWLLFPYAAHSNEAGPSRLPSALLMPCFGQADLSVSLMRLVPEEVKGMHNAA